MRINKKIDWVIVGIILHSKITLKGVIKVPRRRTASDVSKLEKGRGAGHGKDYTPFLTVREVPSKGQRNREPGWKTGRAHHFLSNGEKKTFMIYEWSPPVVDIREQFPLPQEHTIDIAARLNIKHPTVPGTSNLDVMTTDFVLDVLVGGKVVTVARAVKENNELNNFRVIEKLEMERTYWSELKVDWGVITPDREFPKVLSDNVVWVHSAFYLEDAPCRLTSEIIMQVEELLYEQLAGNTGTALSHMALMADKRLDFPSGTCIWIVKHLIATQKWHIDMYEERIPDTALQVTRGTGVLMGSLNV